jgi:hypothetical protein
VLPTVAGVEVSEAPGVTEQHDHLLGEVGLAGREQVGQGLVGREADRLVLVGQGALGGRPPE